MPNSKVKELRLKKCAECNEIKPASDFWKRKETRMERAGGAANA